MRVRSFLRKLGLSLASLLVATAALELAARLCEPGPFSLYDRRPYMPHASLDYVHRPGFEGRWDGTWYAINSLGLRGPELPTPRRRGEYRVVCLGDSCTFGKGVEERSSWPRQLEALLAAELGARATPVVANLGVNGYSGAQYRTLFLERGVALEPDLVVVGYNLNDFPNVARDVDLEVYGRRGLRRILPQGLRDGFARLALYRLVRATFYDWNRARDWQRAERYARLAAEGGLEGDVWARQEQYLREIAQAAGARVLCVLFPYESQIYLDSYDRVPIELLRGVCERLGIPFVSLDQAFRARAREVDPPRELFLRGDRYHPRPEGYRIVAECVLAAAREHGFLPH